MCACMYGWCRVGNADRQRDASDAADSGSGGTERWRGGRTGCSRLLTDLLTANACIVYIHAYFFLEREF
jgi:hypothetical protein